MGLKNFSRLRLFKKTLKRGSLVLAIAAAGILIVVSMREPRLDRVWDEDVSILAGVDFPIKSSEESSVELTRIRDWVYADQSIVSKNYVDVTYDPADLVEMWMYEQELDSAGRIAHTFLVFEFDDSYGDQRFLGLSVETRREEGEEYSLLGGSLRAFEITHIWATERDLVRRRVQYLDYPLTRYRLQIPEETRSRIFVKMARETKDLSHSPKWYNTVVNNCTSSLIKYVNESEPGAIPFHFSYVFTGRVDDYLEQLGYLDGESALAVTREYLTINALR